jgi:hypothetical protein
MVVVYDKMTNEADSMRKSWRKDYSFFMRRRSGVRSSVARSEGELGEQRQSNIIYLR